MAICVKRTYVSVVKNVFYVAALRLVLFVVPNATNIRPLCGQNAVVVYEC